MKNKLEQLGAMTTVVADTGDIEAIKLYNPVDATTNPSLLLKVAQKPEYKAYLDKAIHWSSSQGGTEREQLDNCVDKLAVDIGLEILTIIPGRISTEVSAALSFDTQATLEKARKLVRLYNEAGVGKERILIKIAASWEGIRAAEILEKEGVQCNLTLLFGFSQALACADAGVYLISPFVGRILDWYKAATGKDSYAPEEDPGIASVSKIYNHYKSSGYDTIVMGASFRNVQQIEQLAGCDRLTISPPLLEQLSNDQGDLPRKLGADGNAVSMPKSAALSEGEFRWQLNEDAMATEKLAEGIRNFYADQYKLEMLLKARA